ncbi:MFS transporter [Niallia sp. 03091]|uniref:MFS transporter n=1 Tax=unclassified Niallia TaxID=2837522 RepID=UPI004043BE11
MKKGDLSNFISAHRMGQAEENKSHSIFLLLSVCAGAFLSHFSAGFVNIALTDISIYYSSSLSLTQWIVNGYLLSIMLFLPFMGKLADRYGKKRIHNVGYLVFAVGASASALSPSISVLILCRIIQGIGASMLQAVNMAIVTDSYPDKHRGKALGIISTSVGIGALLGPSVGGFIINAFTWQMLFWTIVPISVIAFLVAQRFIPTDRKQQTSSFDYLGSVLFGISIVSFVIVLNSIGEGIVYSYLIFIFILSIGSFFGFIYWSKRVEHPFIHPRIFSSGMVRAGGIILIISYCATFASMVILPFYLRGILGYSADQSGLLLMCYPLLLALFGPVSGSLSDRYGSIKVVLVGLSLLCASMIGLSLLSETTTLPTLIFLFSLLGFSMGILTSPNYSIMMFYVPIQFLGMMSSTIALLRNIGMVLGTAISITFMNSWLNVSMEEWMSSPHHAGFEQVMSGFHYLFLLLCGLTLLVVLYFIRSIWKAASIEKERN